MWWGRVLLAVLAPVLLSAGWVAWLCALGAMPPGTSERATELDAQLDAAPFDVLVLGNSAANRGIDTELLAERIGRPTQAVTQAATLAPSWYVILRDRVYARGLVPDLVLIADTPPGMLAVQPFSEHLHAKMMELASGPDPVRARADVDKSPLERRLATISVMSTRIRETVIEGLRNTAVGLLFAPPGTGPLQTRGNVTADAAVEAVLHAGGIRAAGPEGALALDLRKPQDVTAIDLTEPAHSFVKDTIDLVQAHGGTLVYVHLPRRSGVLDPITFASRANLVEYLNQRDVWFVDLSALPNGAELFADNNHLLPEGRRVLTELLAATLAERGVLDGNGFVPAVVPSERATVTRLGDLPALPVGRLEHRDACTYEIETPAALSAPALAAQRVPVVPLLALQNGVPLRRTEVDEPGCTGTFVSLHQKLVIHPTAALGADDRLSVELDPAVPQEVAVERRPLAQWAAVSPSAEGVAAWWVYPGTSLVIEEPMSPPSSGAVEVRSSALVIVQGRGHPRVTVQDEKVRYVRDGRVLRATPIEVAGDEPLTVSWISPPGGPTLLVRDVRVGPLDAPRYVVGSAESSTVRASFLPSEESGATVSFDRDPPALVRGPVQQLEEGKGILTVLEGPQLTMAVASKVAGRKHCAPMAIDLGGTEVDARPTPSGMEFEIPPDQRDRVGDARPYLHPERRCTWWPAEGRATGKGAGPLFMEPLKIARWLYPGDVATFARPDIAEMHGSAGALHVEGFRFGPEATLTVELKSGEGTETFQLETGQDAFAATFPLATRLDPRTTGPTSLTLRSAGDDTGFFYVTDLHLLEAEP